jgi:hypothetical protein
MQPFQATLSDETGQEIARVEGSIQPSSVTQKARTGSFDIADNGDFAQGVLDDARFRLRFDNGDEVSIKIDSLSVSTPGHNLVEFTCA